ncbi:MAG: diphosphate--fructose-6-phosphate 1-phosphotransferase [Chlamydiota bacterium]
MALSPLLKARQKYHLRLPEILQELDSLMFSKSLTEEKSEIQPLFPHLVGYPLLKGEKAARRKVHPLTVGVVLSGGQAAGGHNVIIGLFDALKQIHPKSTLLGFLEGPSGIVEGRFKNLEKKELENFRNTGGFDLIGSGRTKIETPEQFEKSLEVMKTNKIDALVVIGGDDSNTNAALLAEYFLQHGAKTQVIGVPKTIDGDLQNSFVDISFGFDTACKTYSEMIGNIAKDALSAKKYTHFIKLMGRSASHIALECALQTHPNLTFIGEEIAKEKKTLQQIGEEIADLVIKRAEMGKNYGVILIPEGLIEAIEEMGILFLELNRLLVTEVFKSLSIKEIRAKIESVLQGEVLKTFSSLPEAIQLQILSDRDPHGNIQVAHIDTEKLLMQIVLKILKQRNFQGKVSFVNHFFGYEGRAGFPSNFDATYCYALGFTAAALIQEGVTGYMACVSQLTKEPEQWGVYGLPLLSLMHLEMRKGKQKPVIAKALVSLTDKPFQFFKKHRSDWMYKDDYQFPGPIQFFGDEDLTNSVPIIVSLKKTE